MGEPLKLMCVLAHPDDESLGTGGILAKYAAEGVETYVLSATRGERGWFGPPDANPGLEALGRIREAELRAAAEVLGVRCLEFLDYVDGDLDQADPAEAIGKITDYIRKHRPDVVVTFDPLGAYGHPDHIAICQFTTAAAVCAADPGYRGANGAQPHRISKLYYMATSERLAREYQAIFGDLVMCIDGVERRGMWMPDWAITTRVDASAHWRRVWQAVLCHQTQIPGLEVLRTVPQEKHEYLWGTQEFYRAYSTVNGGRGTEYDLFVGLR